VRDDGATTAREVRAGDLVLRGLDSGSGEPPVVFVGGAGGLALAWEPVRRRVAEVTRALAYDRPGYGLSAMRAGPPVTSPRALAAELDALLAAAGVARPVVLVAHSSGGFVARAFASAHRADVAGLVLVDAASEDEWTDSYPDEHRRGLAVAARSLGFLARQASWGLPQLLARLPFVPLGAVDRLPAGLRDEARRQGARRSALRTAAAEFAGLEGAAAEMAGVGDLGDLPLVVLSHGRSGEVPAGVDAEQVARVQRAAQESQRRLAALSTRGELQTTDTGPDPHVDVPEVVVRAVLDLALRG
jgi:pimeloyl-ACP methyl ester carboxylesterase